MQTEIQDFPEEGEVVVGTISRVETYGLYVSLDEYSGLEGFVSVKEIPSNLARNIQRVFKPKQKVVLKVVYSNPRRLQVDLSLKRLTNEERRQKLILYKQEVKATKMLNIAKESTNVKDDREVRKRMIKEFGSLYSALEALAKNPEHTIKRLEIRKLLRDKADQYVNKLLELVRERIRVEKVQVSGLLKVFSPTPDGVDKLRSSIESAMKSVSDGASVKVVYVGSPRYRITVESDDYKNAERVLLRFVESLKRHMGKDGFVEFEQEKRK